MMVDIPSNIPPQFRSKYENIAGMITVKKGITNILLKSVAWRIQSENDHTIQYIL